MSDFEQADPVIASLDKLIAQSNTLHDSLKSFVSMLEEEASRNEEVDADHCISPEALASFYSTFLQAVSAISHRCTAVVIAFESPPYPSGQSGAKLVLSLSSLIEQFAQCCTSWVPCALGGGLSRLWTTTWLHKCVNLCHCLSNLALSLKSIDSRQQLQQTGTIWEACDDLKALSPDVQMLLHNQCTNVSALVDDATSELQQSGELTDEPTAAMLKRIIALCKCTKNTVTCARAKCPSMDVTQLASISSLYVYCDDINDRMSTLSELIDNLATAYYQFEEDQDDSELAEEFLDSVNTLCRDLERILKVISKHNADDKQLQVVRTAIEHNRDQLINAHPVFNKLHSAH